MKRFKVKICNCEFTPISPCRYERDSLIVYYAGIDFGWRLKDGGYNDPPLHVPTGYPNKEAAVLRFLSAMELA